MADDKTQKAAAAEPQDEIDEIMNELEELTKDSVADESSADSEEDMLKDFRGAGDDASMEDTLGATVDEEEGASSGLLAGVTASASSDEDGDSGEEAEEAPAVASVKPIRSASKVASSSEQGTLTMSLTGNMVLQLRYEMGEQEVSVSFADDALRVTLSDGTEFKIPSKTASKRRAA